MVYTRKRFMVLSFITVITVALLFAGCSSGKEVSSDESQGNVTPSIELQIFAANSLSKAMDEVQELYTSIHPEVTFADTQYKASGELVEMLNAGSPADIFISASKGKMDTAVSDGHIDEATRFDMFENDLVMVTGEHNTKIPDGLTLEQAVSGDYSICVGDESVPAGNYACQSLSTVAAYTDASGKGGEFNGPIADKIILDTSVGNVCKHAASGDVDVAFVYSSDVYRFGGVRQLSIVPDNTHKPIIYPAAITSQSTHKKEAQDFLDWAVEDPEAQKIWQKWGFELV